MNEGDKLFRSISNRLSEAYFQGFWRSWRLFYALWERWYLLWLLGGLFGGLLCYVGIARPLFGLLALILGGLSSPVLVLSGLGGLVLPLRLRGLRGLYGAL